MPYQTKAELREELAKALTELSRAQGEVGYAAAVLAAEGYTKVESPGYAPYLWRKTDEHKADEEARMAEHIAEIEKAAGTARKAAIAETRHETLQAVIDALEIKGYAAGGLLPRINESYGAPSVFSLTHATDRFWSDIQTALDVRAERKRDEERKSTEAKVSDLLTRNDTVIRAFYTDPITFGGPLTPCIDEDCSCSNTADVDSNVTAVRLADSAEKVKKKAKKKRSEEARCIACGEPVSRCETGGRLTA